MATKHQTRARPRPRQTGHSTVQQPQHTRTLPSNNSNDIKTKYFSFINAEKTKST
jgi:hypothetical protein